MHKFKYVVLGFFLFVHYVPTSVACSCVPFEASKNFEKASFVFEAFMTKTELVNNFNGKAQPWGNDDSDLVIGNFIVGKIWKGNPENLSGVITHSESPACG